MENRSDGVIINIQGKTDSVDNFIKSLKEEAPTASSIKDININKINPNGFTDFIIKPSSKAKNQITEISPDIAVCKDCLKDMKMQHHRIDYPFVNCTNCGPRFTIIKDLPYDRHQTTMHEFKMCETCKNEYEDILNRRFHAQPVACKNCGPLYTLDKDGELIHDLSEILTQCEKVLSTGGIMSLKGLGGFNLVCDAHNENAIDHLRKKKQRDKKPFAIMVKDIESVKKFCSLSEEEELELSSWRRSIILLSSKNILPDNISSGLNTLGVMLPYLPFHYLLFDNISTDALIMTSGNISEEPIVIDNLQAKEKMSGVADLFLNNNRDIYNRADDSVLHHINNNRVLIRRSRGFVPEPVYTTLNPEGIFAAGAELKNCFAMGKGDKVILSQYIGDLKNLETYEFYEESYVRFKQMFRFDPTFLVCDLHPDYFSSKFTNELYKNIGLRESKFLKIQHHHAHIASCMAEHQLDEKVLGVSFDGTGLGDDENIWGGEFLICDLMDYERYGHIEYVTMPGGDKVADEPWRMGLSYLSHYGCCYDNYIDRLIQNGIDVNKIHLVKQNIINKINAPLTSSSGRLFDAVSAMIGLCYLSAFEAEAPMRLENVVNRNIDEFYPIKENNGAISLHEMVFEIQKDIINRDASVISAKFHNALSQLILRMSLKVKEERGIEKVLLSGGVFQNKYLLEKTLFLLHKNGLSVYYNQQIPSNDGGIALGQLVIAAKKRELCV